MPDPSTVYYLEEGGTRTLAEMMGGIDEECLPRDQQDLESLLFWNAAWETEEGAREAAAIRGTDEARKRGWQVI